MSIIIPNNIPIRPPDKNPAIPQGPFYYTSGQLYGLFTPMLIEIYVDVNRRTLTIYKRQYIKDLSQPRQIFMVDHHFGLVSFR